MLDENSLKTIWEAIRKAKFSKAESADREQLAPYIVAAQNFFANSPVESEDFRLMFPGTGNLLAAGKLPASLWDEDKPIPSKTSDLDNALYGVDLAAPVMFSHDQSMWDKTPCGFYVTFRVNDADKDNVDVEITFLEKSKGIFPIEIGTTISGSSSTPEELTNALHNAFVDFIAERPEVLEKERAKEQSVLSKVENFLGFRR